MTRGVYDHMHIIRRSEPGEWRSLMVSMGCITLTGGFTAAAKRFKTIDCRPWTFKSLMIPALSNDSRLVYSITLPVNLSLLHSCKCRLLISYISIRSHGIVNLRINLIGLPFE